MAFLGLVVIVAIEVRTACEESLLLAHFQGYPAYAKRTPSLIPFLF